MKSTSRAFTLIELLVVIAIIAILAAILFPVFAQAKETAKKARSLSQQKQLGLGIIMYAGDSDDILPPAYTNDPGLTWHFLTYPYLKSYQLLIAAIDAPNPSSLNLNNGWDYIWAYGVMPRADIYQNNPGVIDYTATSGYFFAPDPALPIAQALNMGGVRHEGIFGLTHIPGGGAWGNYQATIDSTAAIVPSLSMTAVKDPSGTGMIFDATDPFGIYINWGAKGQKGLGLCGSYWYSPGDNPIGGLTPRWGGPKHCKGWRNPGSLGISAENAAKLRQGNTNIVFTDGSAKSYPIMQAYKTEPCPNDPAARCMVHFPLD